MSKINTKESSERGTFTPPPAISIEDIEKNKEQYTVLDTTSSYIRGGKRTIATIGLDGVIIKSCGLAKIA